MPLVNGRFYMNPTYGRAVERVRAAENHPGDQDAHWVTINGNHVLIYGKQTGHHADQQAKSIKINKIYNELSGLRPKKGATTGADLNRARRNAAHVYDNVRGRGFQGSSTLGAADARDIKKPTTEAAQAYQATAEAVAEVSGEADTTQNANHMYIYDPAAIQSGRLPIPDWVIRGRITTVEGPFINESGGGDIPRGDEVFVITVNDHNLWHPRK